MPGVGVDHDDTKLNVVLAGMTAGLTTRFLIAPLDVVKIRLQLQTHSHTAGTSGPTYRGIYRTARTIAVQEGITALWKGNVPAEALYVVYGGAQFLAYRMVQDAIPESIPGRNHVAGAAAGAFATTVTYPLDLLRTRFAAQGGKKVYPSLLHAVREITLHEGLAGFFRGLNATITQIVPAMAISFGTKEQTKTALQDTPIHSFLGGYSELAYGSFAGAVSKAAIFPLDLIRKRLQVQGPSREKYVHRIPQYQGVLGAGRVILKTEGVRGLYKGLWASLIKAVPLTGLTFWIFDRAMVGLRWIDREKEYRH